MAAGALLAATLFLLRVRTKTDDAGSDNGPRSIHLAVLLAAMALAKNVAYAFVWFSEIHYRTHIMSRLWASMAIGILAGWLGVRGLRWAASAIVTAFVFFGTWGGIERQDFFLASWRGHQRELASILDAAPSLRPGTAVILRSTATSGRYLAMEAGYLTKRWLRLLYNDPQLRTMRLNPERGSGCKSTAGGIDCWLEGEAMCFANKACEPTRFQFEDLVVMDYDSSSATWHLVRSLRDDPLARGYNGEAERFHPENRIVPQPWTSRQRRLLLMDE
jgi:hypothetical protein